METEQNVAASKSNTDCQQMQGEAEGDYKRHIDPTEDKKHDKSKKRSQNMTTTIILQLLNQRIQMKKLVPLPKLSFKNILTMSVFLDQKPALWVAIAVCQKRCCYLMIRFSILLLTVWMIQKFPYS